MNTKNQILISLIKSELKSKADFRNIIEFMDNVQNSTPDENRLNLEQECTIHNLISEIDERLTKIDELINCIKDSEVVPVLGMNLDECGDANVYFIKNQL